MKKQGDEYFFSLLFCIPDTKYKKFGFSTRDYIMGRCARNVDSWRSKLGHVVRLNYPVKKIGN